MAWWYGARGVQMAAFPSLYLIVVVGVEMMMMMRPRKIISQTRNPRMEPYYPKSHLKTSSNIAAKSHGLMTTRPSCTKARPHSPLCMEQFPSLLLKMGP